MEITPKFIPKHGKKYLQASKKASYKLLKMKKAMEAKIVIRLTLIVLFPFLVNAQEKHLMFSPEKDSIIWKGGTQYYKIDNNLFDINRYNQVDTLSIDKMKNEKFTSVSQLWKQGRENFSDISTENNLFIETYNEIFEHIYILEKLPNSKYKRTRVWWIDYQGRFLSSVNTYLRA